MSNPIFQRQLQKCRQTSTFANILSTLTSTSTAALESPVTISKFLQHHHRQQSHRRQFSNSSVVSAQSKPNQGMRKKKDLEKDKKLPIYDYGKVDTKNAKLYGFGSTTSGALGLQDLIKPKRPGAKVMEFVARPVRNVFAGQFSVQDIAVGHGFTLISTKPDNSIQNMPTLFGCGFNTHSQLGFQAVRPEAPMEVLISIVPIPIPVFKQPKILALGAGRAHSVVSVENGGILTFGDNSNGQCGRVVIEDEKYFGSKFFHKIQFGGSGSGSESDDQIVSICCRFDVTFCLTRGGQIYSFGCNNQGQLGRGAKLSKNWEPKLIDGGDLGAAKVIKVTTSGNSVIAVTENGDIFAWGDNESGQVNPLETSRTFYEPRFVKLPPKIGKVIDAAVGDGFSFILNEKGDVFSWGQSHCLGLGPKNLVVRKPTLIPPPLFGKNEFNTDTKIKGVYAGFFYAAAVTSEGDLYTWGKNEAGCLGLGDVECQTFPMKVCLNGSVHKVGIGVDHTIVLTKGSI